MKLHRLLMPTLLLGILLAPSGIATAARSTEAPGASGEIVRDGVRIEFAARPAGGAGALVEGVMTDLEFRVTDAASGAPLTGLGPGAWLDPAGRHAAAGQKECKEKIGLYLSGVVGVRPMVDLNSYYLLVLNRDPSITVIDPVVSVAGVTSTYKVIMLKRSPMDWVRSEDNKRLYVSMPSAGEVAVIDSESFVVMRNVDAGRQPVRVAMQPDGRYLWIGNNSHDEATSGVTIVDTASLARVAFIATGRGHHEIAFSGDSRHAFVTNRDSGTVTVIDVARLAIKRQLETGPRPVSVAYTDLGKAIYVADAEAGHVRAYDARSLEERATITARPGLGPMRFTRDGRFGFVLNPFENTASVIDAGSASLIHTVDVAAEPYQLSLTSHFAYIRGLGSERVTMVNLASLGKDRKPILQSFVAGALPPRAAGDLPIAESLAAARDDAAVFVVNPADNTTYFYMEGMNAPMANYPNRGFNSAAATIIDRGMRETRPGVYGTRVRFPTAGAFDVAFMLDRPEVLHCFGAEVAINPSIAHGGDEPRVEFLDLPSPLAGARDVPVRFRLLRGRGGQAIAGTDDARLRYFRAPASPAREVAATHLGDGVYEARIDLPRSGAYYLHVGVASLKLGFGAGGYRSIRVREAAATGSAREQARHLAQAPAQGSN